MPFSQPGVYPVPSTAHFLFCFALIITFFLQVCHDFGRSLLRALAELAARMGIQTPVQHAMFSGYISVVTGLIEASLSMIAGEQPFAPLLSPARLLPLPWPFPRTQTRLFSVFFAEYAPNKVCTAKVTCLSLFVFFF